MYALGLQQTKEGIYAALLKRSGQGLNIEFLRLLPLSTNPLEGLKEGLEGKKVRFATGLEARDVARRQITVPLKKEKEILATLPFQTESLFPFDPKEIIALPFLYPKENGTEVVLFGTKKDFLSTHLKEFEKRGIDADIVSSTPAALVRFCQLLFPEENKMAIVHKTSCVVIENGKIVSAHFLESGEETQRKMEEYIHAKFPDFRLIVDEGTTHFSFDFATLKTFAVPIGLALESLLISDGKSHQFLQGSFLPLSEKKLKKRILKGYVGASCLLTLCIWSIGTLALKKQESALHEKIDTLLENSEKNLSLEDKFALWEEEKVKMKKEFPLLSTTYSASELLAWLGSLKNEISIQQIRYQLVKYPSLNERHKPYQVQVHLTFTADSPEEVRLFRETLKKERHLIHLDQELDWSFSDKSYKTSFFLKSKS